MSEFEIPARVHKLHEDIQENELRYHNKRVAVTKEFIFDAAHHLHLYEGKCKSLHGHTYHLEVTVSGYTNHIGLVIDFNDLKRIYKERIGSRLDHRYLNAVLPPMNTSVENMIVWIWEQLDAALAAECKSEQEIRLEKLVLHETPTSRATLKRDWMA